MCTSPLGQTSLGSGCLLAPPSLLPQGAAWTRGSRDWFPCGHWTTVPGTLSPRQSGRKAGPVVGFCALSQAGQPDHFPLNGHWRDSLIQIFSSSEQSKSLTETAQGPGSTPTWGPRPAQSCGDPASQALGPMGQARHRLGGPSWDRGQCPMGTQSRPRGAAGEGRWRRPQCPV